MQSKVQIHLASFLPTHISQSFYRLAFFENEISSELNVLKIEKFNNSAKTPSNFSQSVGKNPLINLLNQWSGCCIPINRFYSNMDCTNNINTFDDQILTDFLFSYQIPMKMFRSHSPMKRFRSIIRFQ